MYTLKKEIQTNTFLMIRLVIIAAATVIISCKEGGERDTAFAKTDTPPTQKSNQNTPRSVSQEWKEYWYAGTAEITSYQLDQARYGEMRPGTAALIYVTEDFLPEKQVKADRQNDKNIPVLKLNATKKFTTGIYPYSVMTSTFYPVTEVSHALKVSQSMQEWCGHVYAQLNNKETFEISSHSYFESEADQKINLPKDILENELWTQLRINPKELPTGSFKAIPNLEYIRMKHIELKAYTATGTLRNDRYTIEYPSLGRNLTIIFEPTFPHTINGWEETYSDGGGGKPLTTRATKIKTIKSAYWGKNSNADTSLRKELGLE